MPRHEFGIMKNTPKQQVRFDSYEPEKYSPITIIDDSYIEPILLELQQVPCYWHTRQRPEQGLAYYGITLIPPDSIEQFLAILERQNGDEYEQLINLLKQAMAENKYVIHFGI